MTDSNNYINNKTHNSASSHKTPESRALHDALAELNINEGLADDIMASIPDMPEAEALKCNSKKSTTMSPYRAAAILGLFAGATLGLSLLFISWLSSIHQTNIIIENKALWIRLRMGLGSLGIIVIATSPFIAKCDALLLGKAIHRELKPNNIELRILQAIGIALLLSAIFIGYAV